MNSHAQDDRILPEVRAIGAGVVLVLVAAVIILYGMPAETERFWAWTIRPRMTPIVMGASYAAGAYFFVRVVTETRWHRVGAGFLPITLFTWLMTLATFLHWDRFNRDHFAFFAWFGVYIATAVLVPALWLRNRGHDPGTPEPDEVILPRSVRIALAATGIVILVLCAVMWLLPLEVIPYWPWRLTPLTTRVLGGFFALTGASVVFVAADRRWSAGRVFIETAIIGTTLILLGTARAWNNFNADESTRWLWVFSMIAGLFALSALYLAMQMRQRRGASAGQAAGAHTPTT